MAEIFIEKAAYKEGKALAPVVPEILAPTSTWRLFRGELRIDQIAVTNNKKSFSFVNI